MAFQRGIHALSCQIGICILRDSVEANTGLLSWSTLGSTPSPAPTPAWGPFMLRGGSDKVLKRIIGLIPLCLALVALPSLALDDMAPLDTSYEIQNDVSVLSAPPIQTLAAGTEKVLHGGTMPGTGNYFTYYTLKGLSDTVLQDAFNDNARETSNELSDLSVEVNSLKSSVSSALNQGRFEASMDKYWEFFDVPYLYQDGTIKQTTNAESLTPKDWLRQGLMGLAAKMGLGFPDGKSLYSEGFAWAPGRYSWFVDSVSDFPTLLEDLTYRLGSNLMFLPGSPFLADTGLVGGVSYLMPTSSLIRDSFLGLATILRGSSGSSLSGSLLNYSDLSSSSYSSNNILGAFKPLFEIQNDLARLTHVIADPTEQALHDATKDNVQSVTDNLTGSNGVTPSAVGDVAGISSGVGSFMESGVDSSRLSDSLSDSSNFSFFSQQTANDLDTVPSVQSDAMDDYIDFYALNRDAYKRELGD